jgi:photosystem II stability/assembly factor-like uncharacterized protein
MRLLRAALLIASFLAVPALAGLNRWTLDGPAGGKVTQFVADVSAPSTVYAATQSGLYRSADSGQHWTVVPEMFGVPVVNVAVTPADPSRVFAATQSGLFRSSDRGATWTNVSPRSLVAYRLAVSPSNANVLYLDSNRGFGVSTDGGVTFALGAAGLGQGGITSLSVDPQVPSTVYASFNSYDGVFKSVDEGAHWSASNSGLPNSLFFTVYWLEVDPSNGNTIYAAGQGGVYKSTDGGGSWSALNLGTPIGYAYSLSINRFAPSMVFAATANGLFRSNDGGAHWSALAATFNVSSIGITSTDGMSIVTSADFKVSRSSDGGATLQESSSGLTAFSVNAIVTDPRDPSTVYAGGPPGIFKSRDHGRTWSLTGREAKALAIDATDSNTLYMLFLTALYRSVDGGATWDGFSNGLPDNATSAIATPPAIHGRLYAVAGGVIYRRDGEQPWTALTTGLPANGVIFIGFDPSNGQSMFAATASALFRSSDGGNSWSAASLPQGFSPSGLVIDPFDVRHQFVWSETALYVTTDGGSTWSSVPTAFLNTIVFDPTTRGRVYRNAAPTLGWSNDGGKTWARLDYGLGPLSGAVLAIGRDGTLFKGGPEGGVYVYEFGRRRAAGK